MLVPGSVVGESFVVVRELASTATTRIALAEHGNLRYPALVKLARRSEATHVGHEISALRKLRHPNNVQLLDAGRTGQHREGPQFLVREWVEGWTLRQLLRFEGRLAPLRAVHVMREALAGIAEAHAQRVVHGDCKPENLIVRPRTVGADRVVVIDYGVEGASLDARGAPGGTRHATPRYLAPEWLEGGRPTPRSDVFAMGVTLRECLVGAHERLELEATPTGALRELVPIPDALVEALDRALHPDPQQRYRDAAEFGSALAELDENELAMADLGPFAPSRDPDLPTLQFDASSVDESKPAGVGPVPISDLASTGRPIVWLFGGGRAARDPAVIEVLGELSSTYDIEVLSERDRMMKRVSLTHSEPRTPWVVLFEDSHLEGDATGDPRAAADGVLLRHLGADRQVARLLLSRAGSFDHARRAINDEGLDGHVNLPTSPAEFSELLRAVVERSRMRRRYIDGLRLAAADAAHQHRRLERRIDQSTKWG